MRFAARGLIALLPLLLTPLLVHVLAEGYFDLGGGEKDLVLVLPYFLWSFLYAACSLELWRRGWSIGPSMTRSALLATAGLFITALVLDLFGQLGLGWSLRRSG